MNLGCGWDWRDGYLNIDFVDGHKPDLVADVRHLPMLPDGRYEEIVAQDVLEHLQRADAPRALAEWSRLLRPGGKLVLRVPNLLGLAHLLATTLDVEGQRQLIQCLFGTQAYSGDYHQTGYTELLLRHELCEVGLGDVHISSRDEWLFDVVAYKAPMRGDLSPQDCHFMTLERPSTVVAGRAAIANQPHRGRRMLSPVRRWALRLLRSPAPR